MRQFLYALALLATPAWAQSTACKQVAGVAADYETVTPTTLRSSKHGVYSVSGYVCIRFLGDRWVVHDGKLVPQFSVPNSTPVIVVDTTARDRALADAVAAVEALRR